MDKIDHIYYINLEHRVDRKKEFLYWLSLTDFPFEKISRIEAVYNKEFGTLGCGQSHIKALEEFIKSEHNNCIIYEDDYEPVNKDHYWENFRRFFINNIEYDILLCSHNGLQSEKSEHEGFSQVIYSGTASGYLINKLFAPKLLENMKEAVTLLDSTKNKYLYAIDVWWNKLFKQAKVYCFKHRIGFQRGSFSDIEKKYENYKV